jgi:hypothetical protein
MNDDPWQIVEDEWMSVAQRYTEKPGAAQRYTADLAFFVRPFHHRNRLSKMVLRRQ